MKTNWLAASSFEESLKLVEAINNLSTDAKLKLAKIENPIPADRIAESRQVLINFLNRFQSVVQSTGRSKDAPVLGTDPRSGELVRKYLSNKKNHSSTAGLYGRSLDDVLELLTPKTPENLQELIACLTDMRDLVEQHSQVDVNNILGKL